MKGAEPSRGSQLGRHGGRGAQEARPAGVWPLEVLRGPEAESVPKWSVPGPAMGSNERFTRILRENYAILGPMGAPGIDLIKTRFPVTVQRPKASGGQPDLADVIYGIHCCSQGHGDELPDGFGLIPGAAGPKRLIFWQLLLKIQYRR